MLKIQKSNVRPLKSSLPITATAVRLLTSLDEYLRQRQRQTQQIIWHFSGSNDYRESLSARTGEQRSTH
jgi:protein ImuB